MNHPAPERGPRSPDPPPSFIDRAMGYPTTALIGLAIAALLATRSLWIGATVMAVLTLSLAAGERWADRAHRGAAEWPTFRRAYVVLVVVVTIVYVTITGDEFYRVTIPALVFVPAVSSLGRAVRATRHR